MPLNITTLRENCFHHFRALLLYHYENYLIMLMFCTEVLIHWGSLEWYWKEQTIKYQLETFRYEAEMRSSGRTVPKKINKSIYKDWSSRNERFFSGLPWNRTLPIEKYIIGSRGRKHLWELNIRVFALHFIKYLIISALIRPIKTPWK